MRNLHLYSGGRVLPLLILMLSVSVTGCASMQPVLDSMQASLPKLPSASKSDPASSASARPAPSISTTPLAGLFTNKPADTNPYPRVAITVTHLPVVVRSRSEGVFRPEPVVVDGCWTATATLWSDAKHFTAIPAFSVCPDDQSRTGMSHAYEFGNGPALPGPDHTGAVRTQGPRPPANLMPHDPVLDVHRLNLDNMLVVLFYQLGYDYSAGVSQDRRLWFVSFDESQLK